MKSDTLSAYERQLHTNLPLIGGWLRRRAVDGIAAHAHARPESAKAVRLLEQTGVRRDDKDLAGRAVDVLARLAADNNTPAREALCRLVLHHDHPRARRIAREEGYFPHEDSRRALFFFLTEQWDRYEQLDFEHNFLRAAYGQADEGLKRRIATVARRAGLVEWVTVAAGGANGRRLGGMTDHEWRTAVSVLADAGRWSEVWRLAQAAPPRWSARLLTDLGTSDWRPPGQPGREFDDLLRLAAAWPHGSYRTSFQERAVFREHTEEVRGLALSPDGTTLATAGADNTVCVWNVAEAGLQAKLEERGPAQLVAFSPDGRVLACGSKFGVVSLWDWARAPKPHLLKGHRGPINALAVTPDGSSVVSGGADGAIQLWGLPDGASLALMDEHEGPVLALAVGPESDVLASASADSTVRLWSLPAGKRLRTLTGHRATETDDAVHCLAMSPAGMILASGGTEGHVRLWGLPDGQPLRTLKAHRAAVVALAINHEGTILATGGADRSVKLWRLATGKLVRTLHGHSSDVSQLAFSPDDKLLASASGAGWGADFTVRVWDLDTKGSAGVSLDGHTRGVNGLAFHPDGRTLFSCSSDGTARVWSAELERVSRTPTAKLTAADLATADAAAGKTSTSTAERAGWAFVAALIRWCRRLDIVIEDARPRRLEVGAFDIEIEG